MYPYHEIFEKIVYPENGWETARSIEMMKGEDLSRFAMLDEIEIEYQLQDEAYDMVSLFSGEMQEYLYSLVRYTEWNVVASYVVSALE